MMSPNSRGMSFSHTNSPILLHTKVANNSVQLPELAPTPQVKGSIPKYYSYCRHQRKWGSQATCTSTQPMTKQVVLLGLPSSSKILYSTQNLGKCFIVYYQAKANGRHA